MSFYPNENRDKEKDVIEQLTPSKGSLSFIIHNLMV